MAAAAFIRPPLALAACAALFPFDWKVIGELPFTVYLSEALVAGLLAGHFLSIVRKRERITPVAWGVVACWAFVMWAAALSAAHAEDGWAVFKQGLRWSQFWLVLASAAQALDEPGDAARAARWTVSAAFILALLGLLQFATGMESFLNDTGSRMDDTLGVVRAHGLCHPNAFAPYLGTSLLVLLAFAGRFRGSLRGWLFWAVGIPASAALVLTMSRSGWLATAAGLAVWVLVASRRRMRALLFGLVGASVLLAFGWFAVPSARPRIASLASPWKAPQFRYRLEVWKWGLKVWSARPVAGIGAGNYSAVYAREKDSVPERLRGPMRAHAHSFFIQVLMETGLAGLAVWLGALGWLASRLWRARTPERRMAALGLGLLALFLVAGLQEDTLVYARGVVYALPLGLALARSAGTCSAPRKP